MSISEVKKSIVKSGIAPNFLPAVLREYKSGWIVEYYVEHPISHKLERKKIRLSKLVSRYKSVKDARAHASKIVAAFNIKLSTGWNPFFSDEDARLYTSINIVCEAFLKEKEKELRQDSMRAYSSFILIFSNWLNDFVSVEYLSMINKTIIARFMDYVYNQRNVSAVTYNNYVKLGRALFNWAKEKCYTKENPFDNVKVKPKAQKKRIIIPSDFREVIANYLLSTPGEQNYLISLKLIYSALLRPSEIRKIKIENVNLSNKSIVVPSDVSKNKKQRVVPLTDDLIESLKSLNLSSYPTSYYVFGNGFKPNSTILTVSYMYKHWSKLRKKLNLPEQMQQYSLRDTGIFEMLKSGIDPLSVKQHADHHSLEMTTIYSNHIDPNLAKIIREKSPTF